MAIPALYHKHVYWQKYPRKLTSMTIFTTAFQSLKIIKHIVCVHMELLTVETPHDSWIFLYLAPYQLLLINFPSQNTQIVKA